jgi:hypothetical protein
LWPSSFHSSQVVVPHYEVALLGYLAVVQSVQAVQPISSTSTSTAATDVLSSISQTGSDLAAAVGWLQAQVFGSASARVSVTTLAGGRALLVHTLRFEGTGTTLADSLVVAYDTAPGSADATQLRAPGGLMGGGVSASWIGSPGSALRPCMRVLRIS